MVKVKICGVTDGSCVDALNELTPDYVGFILSDGYRRSVSVETALCIRKQLNSSIICAGVFVNENVDRVVCAVESGAVQVVQLHGSEDEDYISRLKSKINAEIIKRVSPVGAAVPQNCDFVLLDGTARKGAPSQKLQPRVYDEIKKPYFIAGGLTPENVQSWIRATAPYGADCSGGVETDGKKDGYKIAAFIKNAREVL